MPDGLTSPGSTFSVMMYNFMSEGLETQKAYATGTVLIIFVLLLNLLVTAVQKYFNNKAAGKTCRLKKLFANMRRRKDEENR